MESWLTSHDPDFRAKAADVCGLYLDPPENAVVWSVDEKTGIQASSRVAPTRSAIPGTRARQEFEYRRHGKRRAGRRLGRGRGMAAGWVSDSPRIENFVAFISDLVDQTPAGLDLHCICDNISAHKTPLVAGFLAANPQVHLHFTPTRASWLNQVELFFSILERRLLRRGEFDSAEHLTGRDHRVHQRLRPAGETVPLDLRRPPPHGRVSHND